MTPEQRLNRAEYILARLTKSGREARAEFREKINMLIEAHMRNEATWRAESQAVNEQIQATNKQIRATNKQLKVLAIAQAELTTSQKLTDRALRDFINSQRKGENGTSSS